MNAKAYDRKTAAFAGYLLQNVPEIDGCSMNYWMNNPAALKELLLGLQREPSLFLWAATNSIGGSHISTLVLNRNARVAEWIASLFGVKPDTPIGTLSTLLLESNYMLTREQVIGMEKRTDAGEPTNLHTDGRANFFFSKNPDGRISLGRTSAGRTGWNRMNYPLDTYYLWESGVSLLLCDFNRSKL